MDDELVLLTSYFNLADGRRQDTADTFRVDPSVPSGTSPDGNAALYIVTESSAGGHMGPRARRLAADTVAWEYATHSDDPPAARLKAALRVAHNEVLREFDGHVAVGLSVIAVEGETVYLGQVAPSQVYVVHDGSLHSISASVEGPAPFARAMGSSAGPRISVFRDQIGADDVLALCSSWYHRGVDPADLRECFGAGTADDIAQGLFDLARQHDERNVTVVVIESVPANVLEAASVDDQSLSFMEQVDSAVQALAGVGRLLWEEFRTPTLVAETNGRHREADSEDLEPATVSRGRSSASEVADPDLDYEPWAGRHDPETVERAPQPKDQHTAEMPLPSYETEEIWREPSPETEEVWQEPLSGQHPAETFEEPTREIRIRHDQFTDEVPIVPADATMADATMLDVQAPAPWEQAPPDELPPVDHAPPDSASEARPARRDGGRRAGRRKRREQAAEQASELEQVNSRLQNGPDMEDVIPPVQAFPDTSTEPSRIYATSKDMQAVNKRPRRLGGISRPARDPLAGPPVIRPGLGGIDLDRPSGRPAPPAVIWFGIALIFVLAAGALYVYYRNHRHHLVTDPYPARASKNLRLALASKTPSQQDFYLAKARTNISQAQQFGAPVTTIKRLNTRLQTTSDTLHHITRVAHPVMLSDFGKYPNARPTQIATAPGLVFVLDAGRKAVFSITPNATSNPAEIVQTGDTISGFTVGTPLELATAANTALVFDDHNTLVRDTAGTKTATSLTQATQTESIKSMSTSSPDVYLLDTKNSQVWRYAEAVTGYESSPAGWWDSNPPNLSRAIAIALDGTDLYIMQSDGSMMKYDYAVNPQKFVKPVLKPPLTNPIGFTTGNGLHYVWIADPAHGRILQLDKAGTYVRMYRSSNGGMNFRQISSISVSPDGKTLFVLANAKIFDFPTSP